MLKLMLNLQKFNNYGFFCPVSKVHLTVSSPVGYTNEVTPAILKAVKAHTVIDVDNKIDLKTGTIKSASVEPAQVNPEESVSLPVEPIDVESLSEQETPEESKAPEVPEQPTKTTKRGGRKKESAE